LKSLLIGHDSLRVIFQVHVAVADELVDVTSYDVSLSQVLAVVFDGCRPILHPFVASSQEEEGLRITLILRIIPHEFLESFLGQTIVSIQQVALTYEETDLPGLFLGGFIR